MFNPNRTLIEMEMDRYRPSIDRYSGPSAFDPMLNPMLKYEPPRYYADINRNLIDVSDYKQLPKYKTDLTKNLYDINDHYCMKPIGYIDMENKIIDPIRPYYPIGLIDKGY